MPKFREFEISKFLGIASSNRHPQKNECQECKNFDTRYIDGDLTLRPGFTQKYAAPASADYRSKLSSLTWLAFQNFYVPDNSGKEITVWIGKGTLAGETGNANATPANRNILLVFSSHQFNGTSWVEKNWDGITSGKFWLNHTIVTTLATDSNDYECELDFNGNTVLTGSIDPAASTDVVGVGTLFTTELKVGDRILVSGEVRTVATITDNTHLTVTSAFTDNANDTSPEKLLNLDNWTIINISKSPYEVAQVIETTNYSGSYCQVNITNNAHDWDANDTIVLMKNYIPYDSLIAMYSCTADNITFHKVLNDLRIGFGGQASRIGLSIGYRKKSFLVGSVDFGSFTSTNLESLAVIDNLILDTYIPEIDKRNFSLDVEISTASGNEIAAGRYFFYMTGLLDDFNEILLAETNISLDTQNVEITPKMKFGSHNKRISKIRIYCSSGATTDLFPSTPYYLLQDIDIAKENIDYESGLLKIDSTGWLYLGSATELHPSGDAAAITTESNSIGTFTGYPSAPASYAYSGGSPAAPTGGGSYGIKLTNSSGFASFAYIQFSQTDIFKRNRKYEVTFQHICTTANLPLFVGIVGTNESLLTSLTWKEETIVLVASANNNDIIFAIPSLPNSGYLVIDLLSIKEYSPSYFDNLSIPVTSGDEMVSKLGYVPTFSMIKSWDQAVVTQGRTFFVNPYIDKRYENKIFRSHISGAGAFMYDAASAEEYIDLENFDGNSLVGLEILPNMWFIALKTNGSQLVDPNTGATKSISFGDGCISRRSIINFGDRVVWCGEDDIYMSDGRSTISIAERTIREEYRTLYSGLSGNTIFATRESKDNAYRFLMNAPALEREYVLTKKGWIKRVNANSLVPDYYSTAQDSTVWFMDSGIIYYDSTGVSLDNATTLTANWKSIEIDAELIGEGLTARDFFAINEVWADFTIVDNLLLDISIAIKIYLDNSLYKTFTYTANHSSGHGRCKQFYPMTTKNCRRFYIEVDVSGAGVLGTLLKLHSVGVMWGKISGGHYQ